MRFLLLIFALFPMVGMAQTPAPFSKLNFLLGSWRATTSVQGTAGAAVLGTYTFASDSGGTVISRTSSADTCKGPANFDCQHHDLLTIYKDIGDPVPHAFYADSEGHVLHYDISFPDAKTAVFITTAPGPRFRLTYHLEGAVMSGKFQFAAPGSSKFKSYLEWSGTKK